MILRHIVIFIWPIPFLLGFVVQYDEGWPKYLAYAAVAVLAAAAVGAASAALRRDR